MMPDKITEAVIYESPDGGETVYVRESGSVFRQLLRESPKIKKINEQIDEDNLWNDIRLAAKTDAALHSILEQAKIIYYLSKN
jgi:hypothetical protein